MKKLFLSILCLFLCVAMQAQSYNVPKNYKFENKEAYATYESQVVETINWILETPLGKEANKRQEANAFLMAWTAGSPSVGVDINPKVINFISLNPELLMCFIAGWVKFSLENSYSKDKLLLNKAGIETVASFYTSNRGYLKKDGNIEKWGKLIEKGKLEEELNKKLK